MENWKRIEEKLISTLNVIFNGYDITSLSFYEKKETSFCETLRELPDNIVSIKNNDILKLKCLENPNT